MLQEVDYMHVIFISWNPGRLSNERPDVDKNLLPSCMPSRVRPRKGQVYVEFKRMEAVGVVELHGQDYTGAVRDGHLLQSQLF